MGGGRHKRAPRLVVTHGAGRGFVEGCSRYLGWVADQDIPYRPTPRFRHRFRGEYNAVDECDFSLDVGGSCLLAMAWDRFEAASFVAEGGDVDAAEVEVGHVRG